MFDGGRDAGFVDLGATDLGFEPDAGERDAEAPDLATDAGFEDGGPDAGPAVTLLISEILVRTAGLEWLELHNPGTEPVDLTGAQLRIGDSPGVPLVPQSGSLLVAPGAYVWGVLASPGQPIPADTDFVVSAASADALADDGDVVAVWSASGVLIDRVDFSNARTSGGPLAPNEFPVVAEYTLQLDPGVRTVGGNDAADQWCAQVFAGNTPGFENRSCLNLVINEVNYDFGSITGGGDQGREFIELAGPAGAPLFNLSLTAVEGGAMAGLVEGNFQIQSGRLGLDGLYVLADRDTGGTTFVAEADQVINLDLENAGTNNQEGDALQLIHAPSGQAPVLLDTFAYGPVAAGLVDLSRGLAVGEGEAVPDVSAGVQTVNWARSDDAVDTNDNRADFRYDPTPTPGARNGQDTFAILSVEPALLPATQTATVALRGRDLTDAMVVRFGNQTAACIFFEQQTLRCEVPANGIAAAADIVAMARPEHGGVSALSGVFAWTGPNNGSGAPEELDYCNLQFPASTITARNVASAFLYGRVFEAGITDVTQGASAQLLMQVGWGPSGSDPRSSAGWIFGAATFNQEYGNDDEYRGSVTIPQPGSYLYTFRVSRDQGRSWTYCDRDGAGSNPGLAFDPAMLGVITVN